MRSGISSGNSTRPSLPAETVNAGSRDPAYARRAGPSGLAAAGVYLLITIVFTWPLVLGLARDIPWDLGDSLLNCWILGWDADHLVRLFSGHPHALQGFWN